MREYEELIYSIDVSGLDEAWNMIIKSYNDILPTYWYQLISDYDNYLISYSTSGLLALALYIYGKQNSYINACELYYKIITYDGEGDLFEAIKETQLNEIDYIFYSNIESYITHMMFK